MAVAAPPAGPPATTQVMAQGTDANAPAYTPTTTDPAAPPTAPLTTTLGGPQGPRAVANLPRGYVLPGGGVSTVAPTATTQAAGAAEQPQLDFMTPAMQKYVNQFQQSQAAQRQAIDAGLVQALAGLGQRRDASAKVAATLPDEFNKAYAQATQSQHQAGADAASAFGHPTVGGGADNPLITAANTQERAAGLGAQPLLNAGIAADYSKGATALSNTKLQNDAAVAQQQQAFDQQMLQSQAQYQAAQQQQQAGYAHDVQMAELQSALGTAQYRAENPNKALTPEQQQQYQNQANLDQQATAVGFHNYAQLQQVSSDPFYKAIESAIVTGKTQHLPDGTGVHGSRQALINQAASSNYDVIRALLANHVITAADIANLGK